MSEFVSRFLTPCKATWNSEPSCPLRADGWHECAEIDAFHDRPHACRCGSSLPPVELPKPVVMQPDPDFEDPGIPERAEKSPEQRYHDQVLGALLMIVVTLWLILGTLVGILTAVLNG